MDSSSDYSSSWRAKLFSLSFDGQWNDVGTGQVYIEDATIKLCSEEVPDEIVLQHNMAEEAYKR